jgi:hypothetical protein
LRRILVGEAGRRVQGFLAKLGITMSYVLINALLYSVYGKNGAKYVDDPKPSEYRNKWIAGILAPGKIEAVVTFGTMAEKAWQVYASSVVAPSGVAIVHLTHPTYPESKGGTAAERAENTKKMLKQWNDGLKVLDPAIQHKDVPATPLVQYGTAFVDADKVDIPSRDLPAGIPSWMYDNDGWARRIGDSDLQKRQNITITVPPGVIP